MTLNTLQEGFCQAITSWKKKRRKDKKKKKKRQQIVGEELDFGSLDSKSWKLYKWKHCLAIFRNLKCMATLTSIYEWQSKLRYFSPIYSQLEKNMATNNEKSFKPFR